MAELLQFISDNKEWLVITLGGVIAWLFENRRAARKAKSEEHLRKSQKYLELKNFKLEEATASFKLQQSLRQEMQSYTEKLKAHIVDSEKKIRELEAKSDILQDTMVRLEKFLIEHKFMQANELDDLQQLNDRRIATDRTIVARIDSEDWEDLKELALANVSTGDEVAVILTRVIANNESVDQRHQVPKAEDILA